MGVKRQDTGFWGSTTATIDWCEKNYEVTKYVAEYWNTVSNSVLCIGALYGLWQVKKYGMETRLIVCYLGLLSIGVGSTLFHGTLKYEMQLMDELPMIFGMVANLYVLCLIDKPRGRNNLLLMAVLLCYSALITAVYIVSNNPIFFETMFGILIFVLIVFNIKLARKNPKALKTFSIVGISIFAAGFVFWLVDNRFCHHLTSFRGRDLGHSAANILFKPLTQTHAWWHVCAGISGYMQILLVTFVRQTSLEKREGNSEEPCELTFTKIIVHSDKEGAGDKQRKVLSNNNNAKKD